MLLASVHRIDGVFSEEAKRRMVEAVPGAVVTIEDDAARGLTWVQVHHVSVDRAENDDEPPSPVDAAHVNAAAD